MSVCMSLSSSLNFAVTSGGFKGGHGTRPAFMVACAPDLYFQVRGLEHRLVYGSQKGPPHLRKRKKL